MIYLSQTLYPWWLGAFALGLAAAFLAPRGGERFSGAWLVFVLSLFGLGAVAAFAHAVPGRAGLWLETGVLALAAYGVGCVVGAALAAPFVIGARVAAPASAGASALAANSDAASARAARRRCGACAPAARERRSRAGHKHSADPRGGRGCGGGRGRAGVPEAD